MPRLQYEQMTTLESLSSQTEFFFLCDGCGNQKYITTLDLSAFPRLQIIDIGNNCLQFVTQLVISHLPQLTSLLIGWRSFHQVESCGHMEIHDCQELQHIHIGLGSFDNYQSFEVTGTIEMMGSHKGLDALKEIRMAGLNFIHCSLQLQSKIRIRLFHKNCLSWNY